MSGLGTSMCITSQQNINLISSYVNDVPYSGTVSKPPFDGVIPNGTIFWTADYIYNKAGFKICRTNVSVAVTTMTTIYQPPNMSDQSYNEFWGVTEGDCFMDTSGCIASDNFPEEYGYSHVCLIELTDLWEGASIDVIAFPHLGLFVRQRCWLHVLGVLHSRIAGYGACDHNRVVSRSVCFF